MPVSVPNIITIFRILLVPVTVWLMIKGEFGWAFAAFVTAGISDGVDGYIARRYNLHTDLGAHLDPLADKALLVSIFVVLGFLQHIPDWLVILVVTRDVLIVGAVLLAWVMGKPIKMQPLWVSKVNTAAQIIFAGAMLAILGLGVHIEAFMLSGATAVTVLTLASGALYMRDWLRHMASGK